MAQYEELAFDQGADIAVEVHLFNTDETKKNLQGYSVAAQMRRTVNTSDSDAVTFTTLVADPAADGIITLTLTNQQTDALTPGRYFYDVEISFTDSAATTFVERVLEGIVDVKPSITRI